MSSLQIVVGGQFGSEGKGHVAAQLARRLSHPLVIRTGGPNAGHTVLSSNGKTFKLRQLPTAAVSSPTATLAIAAGSVVDPEVLAAEMAQFPGCRVYLDYATTILTPGYRQSEEQNPGLVGWSTCKGIGAARAARIMRTAPTASEWMSESDWHAMGVRLIDVAGMAREALRTGSPVLVEAAQGYGLGLHTRFYPKTTSANCRAIDALADIGVMPPDDYRVWVVARPYPIRVAGDSGPLHGETSWSQLGLSEERTTVTNKVRRVGQWDAELLEEAIRANGGPSSRVQVALTMLDQVIPAAHGLTTTREIMRLGNEDLLAVAQWVQRAVDCGASIGAIGTGPDTMFFPAQPMTALNNQPVSIPIDSAIHRGGE